MLSPTPSQTEQKRKEKKTKRNETKRSKTKQNKTKQNKTKQNKTKQNKTKQNKTKQSNAQQSKAKQNKTKQRNETKIISFRVFAVLVFLYENVNGILRKSHCTNYSSLLQESKYFLAWFKHNQNTHWHSHITSTQALTCTDSSTHSQIHTTCMRTGISTPPAHTMACGLLLTVNTC